jgi:two-component system nitrogen regulation response regulator GlnG
MHRREQREEKAVEEQESIYALMGPSAFVRSLDQQVRQVAQTNFTVILQGETGTGKELVARLLHARSDRAARPFVPIDCGAIPDSLMESALFGYVKGAFTGAENRRAGYFELTHGGTLFLDEIAHLSLTTQVKFLRVLQEGQVYPLGSKTSVQTDARLIVAANVVLAEEVQAGRFRADLFHRLNEFAISLTRLRDRRDDILFLAERFRHEANGELEKRSEGFSSEAQAYLLAYEWPGNVRELRNAIRRAVLLSQQTIELKHLRQVLSQQPFAWQTMYGASLEKIQQGNSLHNVIDDVVMSLEKTLIQHTLEETEGNKRHAAARLHIGYKTLFRKLREYNID